MTTEQIVSWLITNIIPVVCILSTIIQVAPIKWNPITSFINWLGKIITADLDEKMDELTETVDDIQEQVDENEKDRIRYEVLSFANSCRNNCNHTKEEFDHIIDLNDKYQVLLNKTKDKNGVFEAEYEYIQELYKDHQKNNTFLK